jgi:hypothetical protein
MLLASALKLLAHKFIICKRVVSIVCSKLSKTITYLTIISEVVEREFTPVSNPSKIFFNVSIALLTPKITFIGNEWRYRSR